jgi:hypothetical protein
MWQEFKVRWGGYVLQFCYHRGFVCNGFLLGSDYPWWCGLVGFVVDDVERKLEEVELMSSCKLIVLPCLAAMWLECWSSKYQVYGVLGYANTTQQEPCVKWDCNAIEANNIF